MSTNPEGLLFTMKFNVKVKTSNSSCLIFVSLSKSYIFIDFNTQNITGF